MFSRSILGEKNPKCQSGGRKSTYCDASDFQPTAQEVKSGLNLLPLLLIDHKYIHEVGKLSRTFFPAAFCAKRIRNTDLGDENRHTAVPPISNLRSTSQIGFKSSLNASNTSIQIPRSQIKIKQIHR